jgi:hypothetical protein
MGSQGWHILAVACGTVLVTLLGWALWGDTIRRGRRPLRRCPRCRYNLTATEGLRCSECGFTARSERALLKPVRRWKIAILSCALLLACYPLARVQAIQARGWPAAIPTTVILAAMPWIEPPDEYSRPPEGAISRQVWPELVQRVSGESLWRWQSSWLVSRCLRSHAFRTPPTLAWQTSYGDLISRALRQHVESSRSSVTDPTPVSIPSWIETARGLASMSITTREVWPIGVPIFAAIDVDRFGAIDILECRAEPICPSLAPFQRRSAEWSTRGSQAWDHLVCLGTVDGECGELGWNLMYDLIPKRHWVPGAAKTVDGGRLTLPCRIAGTVEEVTQPVSSPAIDAYLRQGLEPAMRVSRWGAGPTKTLWLFPSSQGPGAGAPAETAGVTFASTIELLKGDDVRATARVMLSYATVIGEPFWDGWMIDSLAWRGEPPSPPPGDVGDRVTDTGWFVRVTSDGELALRDFQSDRHWKGSLLLPVTFVIDN